MEKYSQFRDRGSGIAPFLPVPRQATSAAYLPISIFLFVFRLPLFVTVVLCYFLLLRWLPLGTLVRKALLWLILAVPGVWWIDLQIDGVKKGSLAKQRALRLPQSSDIIAASFTSPLDALYLGAVFDPIFVASYAGTRQVHRISLRGAMLRAFRAPRARPPPGTPLLDLGALMAAHPRRIFAVFPETTTTNGRGVLRLSPGLLTAAPGARVFPFSLRYTPADVTTPVPGYYATFLWNLLSEPTHCIRVRIAECVHVPSKRQQSPPSPLPQQEQQQQQQQQQKLERPLYTNGHAGRGFMGGSDKSSRLRGGDESVEERQMMDKVAESLARLGRVKRVDLGPAEKLAFIDSWNRNSR